MKYDFLYCTQDPLNQNFWGTDSHDFKSSHCNSVLKIGFGTMNLVQVSQLTN